MDIYTANGGGKDGYGFILSYICVVCVYNVNDARVYLFLEI